MQQKPLPERELRLLISHHRNLTLDAAEETLVEEEILKVRHGDGTVSLRQIYDVLQHLYNSKKISISDKKSLMKNFEEYFGEHFS